MSGIFGIFNRNGKAIDEQVAETMLDAISYWEPDEKRVCIDGPVALGHTMLWNTPESKYEHLPLENDLHILTIDVRIDNRDELLKKLELPNRPITEIGDSEFVLAAYKKWGENCPKYLLGDFAFAIWDKAEQQLFCARDHIGIKIFHYYLSDDLFVFSNNIKGVLAHNSVPRQYDDKTIAQFLRDQGLHTERSTFFEKIKKLPPATSLIIKSNTIIEKKYWNIEDIPPISYDTYDEYVEKLRELFNSAVEARLRTVYPVISHLSGGIDSSPIAVLAARKLKEREQPLYAYNWVNIPEKGEDYEFESWDYSRRIAENENIIHQEFRISPEYVANFYDKFDVTTNGTMFYWREYYIQEKAKEMNVRTVLSGWGGDELISYNGYSYVSGLFWQGKIVQAFKYLYDEKIQKQYTWLKFSRRCAREILYPIIYKWLDYEYDLYDSDDYAYIQKNFIKVMKKYKFKEMPLSVGVKKRQKMLFHYGHLQERIESWAMSSFSNKTEYSYPLLDRRLVEFAIGIPEDMFAPKEMHRRFLWRKSIELLLPFDIVWLAKYAESRIEETRKQQYRKALHIWYEKHKNDTHSFNDNKYINYSRIISKMKKFDFINGDPHSLKKVVVALLMRHHK